MDPFAIGHFPRRCAEVVTMDVRAIVVVGANPRAGSEAQRDEFFAGVPYGLVDILGKPIVFHIIDRLKKHDISAVSVVTDAPCEQWPVGTAVNGTWISSNSQQLWKSVEQVFTDLAQDGAELVVVM